MDTPFLGMICMFGFNFAPRGWALCDGQILSISTNTALFSLLGTTYGGNGQTTFALPDLRGRTAVGFGQGPGTSNYVIGERIGSESAILTLANMPSHNHDATAVSTSTSTSTSTAQGEDVVGTAGNPRNNLLAAATAKPYAPAGGNEVAMDPKAVVTTTDTTTNTAVTVLNNGGSQPFGILQPLLALNYSIALQGIFPSRN